MGLIKVPYREEMLSKRFSLGIMTLDYSEHVDSNQFKAARGALVSFFFFYLGLKKISL